MDRAWYALPVGIVVGIGTAAFAPLPEEQALILGITLFAIALWIGNPVPPWYTGLLALGLIGLAFSPDLALGGFAEPALWLIVFGLIIGEAVRQSGLAGAVERRALRWVAVGLPSDENPATAAPERLTEADVDSVRVYRRLLFGLCLGGLLFALVLPSALVRVLILAPILVEVGSVFDSREARLGLLFGPLFSTFYGAVGVLTAAVPNIVIAGIVESIAGTSISWTEWFVSVFPIMGLGRVLLIAGVIYFLYRPDPDSGISVESGGEERDPAEVRRTVAFLLVGVAIWATDFVHGLHPVFGALVVAALLLLPGIGTVPLDTVGDVDFSIIFFVGAVFAVAAGLSETGFTDVAAEYLLSFVPAEAPLPIALLAVFGVTLTLVFILEGVAVSSVLTPVLISFVAETGLPLTTVAIVEAIALGHYFFPYQSIVLVAMLGYGPVEPRNLIRVAFVLSIATILLLLPLQLLYFLLL